MPLQRGWTADVVRRAERFLSLLPDKDLEVVVKQFAPSVPLKCKDDFSAAPRLVLKALAEQYYPDELLEGFALMQKKNMVKFFKDSLGPENCSPRLYEADADELRRWMLEYWFNGPTSNTKALSTEYLEYLKLAEKEEQDAKQLRSTVQFTPDSWQDVKGFVANLEVDQHVILQKRFGMSPPFKSVPTALQQPGGPATFLNALGVRYVKVLLTQYVVPGFEDRLTRAECENIILQTWAGKVSAKPKQQLSKEQQADMKRGMEDKYTEALDAFGDWRGKKAEMRRAAATALKKDLHAEKLESLYQKACKGQPAHAKAGIMIDRILKVLKPYELLQKQELNKEFVAKVLVRRFKDDNPTAADSELQEVKREKSRANLKHIQWELLSAWAQEVEEADVSDQAEEDERRKAEREAASLETRQPKSAKKQKTAKNGVAAGGWVGGGGPTDVALSKDPCHMIQKIVDLAQKAYADAEPTGCNREVHREREAQLKLKDLLAEVYGSDAVLDEKQVPINISLKGRFDLFVCDTVVVELKNLAKLPKKSHNQIRKYMSKLRCHHGVLINFPNDGATSIAATRFIYDAFDNEPDMRTIHAT
ncbi:TPA: hypothetical protein ACH3X2_013103 [Trebouxia sp. C0005]|nr:MAG: hypothetical protein FRX49_04386 [Trebouxia sp. A1-2]